MDIDCVILLKKYNYFMVVTILEKDIHSLLKGMNLYFCRICNHSMTKVVVKKLKKSLIFHSLPAVFYLLLL